MIHIKSSLCDFNYVFLSILISTLDSVHWGGLSNIFLINKLNLNLILDNVGIVRFGWTSWFVVFAWDGTREWGSYLLHLYLTECREFLRWKTNKGISDNLHITRWPSLPCGGPGCPGRWWRWMCSLNKHESRGGGEPAKTISADWYWWWRGRKYSLG